MLHPCQLANRWFVRTRELKWIMASKSCCSVYHNRNWMRWSNIDSLSSVFTFDTKLHTHKSIIAVNCISSIQQLSSHAQSMSFIVLLGLQFSIVTANFEITVVFLMTKINCACNMHRNNAELNSLFVFWANPLVVPLCVYNSLCYAMYCREHAVTCSLHGWLVSSSSEPILLWTYWLTMYHLVQFRFCSNACQVLLSNCVFEIIMIILNLNSYVRVNLNFGHDFWLQNLNYTSKNCIIFLFSFQPPKSIL